MEPTQDDALLTAYLDGELTPQERQRLEQRLVDELELRQRLSLLEVTWHCLDLLEQESVDAELVETTLKTAAISLSAAASPSRKKNRWGKWGMTVLAGLIWFAITFQLGNWTPPDDPSQIQKMADIELCRQLAETLEKLPPWHKDELLNEEPSEIINELKQIWNAH
ncbi:MAG: zf-HC2 domain-containing protein [Planctomycetaceae bacterium]|jgi:hypothetical protein|nr:zf-HC2 domain-containing protein [Planctomycetaceae bacterium]